MADLLTLPHQETNEDGKVNEHVGYVERLCRVCGKGYLIARGKEGGNCGKMVCMKAEGE